MSIIPKRTISSPSSAASTALDRVLNAFPDDDPSAESSPSGDTKSCFAERGNKMKQLKITLIAILQIVLFMS